ncbi:MAG TPA: SAM-dependent methyltransferase [Acidimicrobiales bacterium]
MTEATTPAPGASGPDDVPDIVSRVPHPARIWDYLLGGFANFAADREAAEKVAAVAPGGLETARAIVQANRRFLGRAVRYLTDEAGIRQFLDIGTGVPTEGNTHEVAQAEAPESRVVYVDNDPIVLALARSLLRSTPEGATAYLSGDLRQPEDILDRARETLDFDRPIALMLVAVLHLIGEDEDAHGIVARLVDGLAPGSYLVVSCLASDIEPARMAEAAGRHDRLVQRDLVLRSYDDLGRFFAGLDLVEPGIVPVHRWRRSSGPPEGAPEVPIYGAVGRKP